MTEHLDRARQPAQRAAPPVVGERSVATSLDITEPTSASLIETLRTDPVVAPLSGSGRIRRSDRTIRSVEALPDTNRIRRQSGSQAGPDAIIRRVVESTQIGKRTKITKWYTTLDPNPVNMRMFDTKEQAEQYERELTAPKVATPVVKEATAKPVEPQPGTSVVKEPTKVAEPVAEPEPEPEPEVSWADLWYAKQDEVTSALSPFVSQFKALDPASSLRIRGSLASGYKGAAKALEDGTRPLFNPEDFDIDAYVVSDVLYRGAVATTSGRAAARGGQVAGSHHPKVRTIIAAAREVLKTIPGNRDSKAMWKFTIIIRSGANATKKEEGDSWDMYDLGYDNYAGYLGVPEPVKTGVT